MNRSGTVALVVAAACWGSLAVTTTIALRGFGPLTLLAGELAVAVLVLGVASVVTGQRLPRPTVPMMAVGLLEPGVAYLTFNFGVQRTSSTHAGLLLGLETVFVVALSMLTLRERPSWRARGGILCAVAGVVVLTWHPGGEATVLGDALVMADVLAAAVSVILTARIVREVPPLALTTVQFATGLVVVLLFSAFAWLSGAEPFPSPALAAQPVVALVLTGCLGTAGGFLIYNWALTRVSVAAAGAAITLSPLFALALSVVALGEPLTSTAVMSAALILTGLAMYYGSGRNRHPDDVISAPIRVALGRRQAPRGRAGYTRLLRQQRQRVGIRDVHPVGEASAEQPLGSPVAEAPGSS